MKPHPYFKGVIETIAMILAIPFIIIPLSIISFIPLLFGILVCIISAILFLPSLGWSWLLTKYAWKPVMALLNWFVDTKIGMWFDKLA